MDGALSCIIKGSMPHLGRPRVTHCHSFRLTNFGPNMEKKVLSWIYLWLATDSVMTPLLCVTVASMHTDNEAK